MSDLDFRAIESEALAVVRGWAEALARMSEVQRLEALSRLMGELEPETLNHLLTALIGELSQPWWRRVWQALKPKRPENALPGLPGFSDVSEGTRRNNQRR